MKLALGAVLAVVATLMSCTASANNGAGEADDEWSYRLTPYLWGAGLDGTVAQFGLPAVRISKDFGEVLEGLDAGLMFGFEARRGRLGLFGDFLHVRLSEGGRVFVPGQSNLFADVRLRTRTTTGLLAGQYRVMEKPQGYLDALVGVRHWSLATQASIRAPLLLTRRDSANWSDPVLGLKGFYRLGERHYLTGWAMLGGFDVGSRSSTDMMAALGWSLGNRSSLLLGYRHLAVDYRRSGFVFDAAQQGPALGLDYRF
jgi:hypothetical protein